MPVRARAPGKLVALGEYAVLGGAPALVLAVDRYCEARLEASHEERCALTIRAPDERHFGFAPGEPSGVALVDLVCASGTAPAALAAWRGALDSAAFFDAGHKLGIGSSAAALTAWAGAWTAFTGRGTGGTTSPVDLAALIAAHRRFQAGRGSGLDVAASVHGGVIEFRLDEESVPHIGSVRLPNSVGFAGIFTGRSASTPALLGRYRAFGAAQPQVAARMQQRLRLIAEAGCAAARGDDAAAFVAAVTDYGRGLEDLGGVIGAEIVTEEHRRIGDHAKRFGVAYKVSGAGGGDLGIAFATDGQALDAFKMSVIGHGFRAVDFRVAPHGLVVEELIE